MRIFCCLCLPLLIPGNYYGTPKPPAEPSPVQPDLVDQVLFDEEFDTEVQRKRTTSVSKMDRKDSAAPEEEDEEDRPPMVNGLAGEKQTSSVSFCCSCSSLQCSCAPYRFPPNLNPSSFLFARFIFFHQAVHYIILSMQNSGALFFFAPYHSFLPTNILRISYSACKVSTKSQEVARVCLRSIEAIPRLEG